jgi:glutamyl-tRNA reductase
MKERIEEFSEKLLALPEDIMRFQMTTLSLNDDLQSIVNKIIQRESEIRSEINAAIDENGKKLYSNEESRKIAFINDSSNDTALESLYDERNTIDAQIQESKVHVEALSNLQRNLRSIMGVMATI